MRYTPIDTKLFEGNRKNLRDRLNPNSMVVLHSADPQRLSGDGILPYHQDSNFFYLTGIDQADSVFLTLMGSTEDEYKEMLFVKKTNEQIAIWEGQKFSLDEASKRSGIKLVKWTEAYDEEFKKLIDDIDHIYLDFNSETKSFPISKNQRLAESFLAEYPALSKEQLSPLMADLRMIKSEKECELIRHAGTISKAGYDRILNFIKPNVWEYEIEAEFISTLVALRSRGFAYNPIIASGPNACILHYEQNDRQCLSGDLVLLDVGAEYANYNADITRTLPISGKFSDRQKNVYQSVLDIKKKATELLSPGLSVKDYNKQIGELMEEQLIKLGLLRLDDIRKQDPKKPLYKKYYMHGTSHHLGLDVHDLSDRDRLIEEGMVLTVEPGIYIREEGIGIRLEDDILIGDNENVNLTPDIPIEVEEIEEAMNHNKK